MGDIERNSFNAKKLMNPKKTRPPFGDTNNASENSPANAHHVRRRWRIKVSSDPEEYRILRKRRQFETASTAKIEISVMRISQAR